MPINLDEIDLRILDALQGQGDQSTTEVAKRVGLSQSPCWRRIRRLESIGVIRERVALLDADLLGFEVTAFASIKLSEHGRRALPEFEEAIEALPEIVDNYAMTGEVDYLLRVITRDIRSYERLLRDELLNLPTVREVHSQIALSRVKCTTRLPLAKLLANADG